VTIDGNAVGLEQSMYDQLNRIAKVGHTLWDCEGKPKPLVVKICLFLSLNKKKAALYCEFCIVTGTQSIHNINSDPTWQTLSIEWWKADQSIVGMTVMNKFTSQQVVQKCAASCFSFGAFLPC